MLSIVNTVLAALALIVFLLLGHLKQMENTPPPDDFDIDLELRSSLRTESKLGACPCDYDVFIKFGCIFTCIFAFSRIISAADGFRKQWKRFFAPPSAAAVVVTSSKEKSLADVSDDVIAERDQLRRELGEMTKQNSELLDHVRTLEALGRRHDPEALEEFECKAPPPPPPPQQNIFIANQNLYVTTTTENYANAQIWSKYLQKKNTAYAPIQFDAFKPKPLGIESVPWGQEIETKGGCGFAPVVVTTEDLQKMRGIYLESAPPPL